MADETRVDSVFARDRFLLRQQHLAIREKYHESDEHGEPILFIERPPHMFRSLLGIVLRLIGGGVVAYGLSTAVAAMAAGPTRGIVTVAAVLGPLFGVLRTNFRFFDPGTGTVIGEFNRKFTVLDRYVLDLTADSGFALDLRIALALGVMLDTGERR